MCYLSIFAKYILKAHSGLKVGRKNWWRTRFSFDTFSQPSSFKSFTVDLEWKCLKCAQRWMWKMSPFIFQSSCFREPLSASFFKLFIMMWICKLYYATFLLFYSCKKFVFIKNCCMSCISRVYSFWSKRRLRWRNAVTQTLHNTELWPNVFVIYTYVSHDALKQHCVKQSCWKLTHVGQQSGFTLPEVFSNSRVHLFSFDCATWNQILELSYLKNILT